VKLRFTPNLALAKRIAVDIGCDDALKVHRTIQRRCPGVLRIHVTFPELSRDEYEDLCYAIESEVGGVHRAVRPDLRVT
jgi:hypothetical protein